MGMHGPWASNHPQPVELHTPLMHDLLLRLVLGTQPRSLQTGRIAAWIGLAIVPGADVWFVYRWLAKGSAPG